MQNRMKLYLGDEYSGNYLRNFCLYWMKGIRVRGDYPTYDEWRSENDLDCLNFGGDLKADTLMSAWTPIKWVADFFNRKCGKKFIKPNEKNDYDISDLILLAEDRDAYLPAKDPMVNMLDRFLELAEKRCNYILLPDRNMNPERYCLERDGKVICLFDEVPATLWHVFNKETLGKYFLRRDGEVDVCAVEEWIRREKLQMGFVEGRISRENVIPLTRCTKPGEAKWFTTRSDIEEALRYMIRFLETREKEFGGNLMGKNNSVKLYTGYSYDLSRVLDTGEKYEAYILDTRRGDSRSYAYLGRRRYLYLEGTAYLVLVSARSVKFYKLLPDENDLHEGRPVVRIKEVLEGRGIKCSVIADYEKSSYSFMPAWKLSLDSCRAVFSKYGFAMQDYFWNDCAVYEFEMHFLKRGHIRINGRDIMAIRSFHCSKDIMETAGEYIELALTGPAEISLSDFEDRMKQIGLEDPLRGLYFNLPDELM